MRCIRRINPLSRRLLVLKNNKSTISSAATVGRTIVHLPNSLPQQPLPSVATNRSSYQYYSSSSSARKPRKNNGGSSAASKSLLGGEEVDLNDLSIEDIISMKQKAKKSIHNVDDDDSGTRNMNNIFEDDGDYSNDEKAQQYMHDLNNMNPEDIANMEDEEFERQFDEFLKENQHGFSEEELNGELDDEFKQLLEQMIDEETEKAVARKDATYKATSHENPHPLSNDEDFVKLDEDAIMERLEHILSSKDMTKANNDDGHEDDDTQHSNAMFDTDGEGLSSISTTPSPTTKKKYTSKKNETIPEWADEFKNKN